MFLFNIDDINHIRSRLYSQFDSTNFNYSYTSMHNNGVIFYHGVLCIVGYN